MLLTFENPKYVSLSEILLDGNRLLIVESKITGTILPIEKQFSNSLKLLINLIILYLPFIVFL